VAISVQSDDADVDPEDIEITSITSASQRRQLLQTTAVVFIVDYIVTFKVSSVNTSDVESIGEDLIATLETAVNDGTFAQTLTSVATEDGSGGLLNSTASDFTSEDVTIVSIRTPTPSGQPTGQPSGQPTMQPSKGDDDDLNLPLIIGLSVGGVFFIVLVAAVAYKVTTLDPKKASKGDEYRVEDRPSEQPQTRMPAPSLDWGYSDVFRDSEGIAKPPNPAGPVSHADIADQIFRPKRRQKADPDIFDTFVME
jgi:hypothetical protein